MDEPLTKEQLVEIVKKTVEKKLRSGTSLEEARQFLMDRGMDENGADRFIFDQVFGGNTRNTLWLSRNIKLSMSEGGSERLIVGSFCSIAAGVKVFLGWNHRTDWVTSYYFLHYLRKYHSDTPMSAEEACAYGDVVIGNDVWLGEACTIMAGVTIGDGAVIAANAHVVKDVGPYEIVGGNPAQLIKRRFSEEQIGALLECKWWDLPDKQIIQIMPYLCSNDVDLAIQKIREVRSVLRMADSSK
ncbi:MAG: hypothetical protein HQL87_04420 [Magnetococcales bacterium]|nr:hypothetical protein [Magnetococcales bacterium]